MRTIKKILSVDRRVSKYKKVYFVTIIIDSDGDEASGYGKDFEVGDHIEVFFDDRYQYVKFQKSHNMP